MRVLAVADSDSYVKWGAAVLDRMPEEWTRSIVVLATPALPSAKQLAAALADTDFDPDATPVLDLADLADRLAVEQPDVVLLSVRGPVVRVLVRTIVGAVERRPVIVSGLPGISIPATRKALYYRAQTDFMLLHSKREIREFGELAEQMGIVQDFGLAALPFLPTRLDGRELGGDIVFAAQAKVPRAREDRLLVLRWLVEAARRHPERRVVIKVRAVAGEQQTHAEKYPYDRLLARLGPLPENLVIEGGSMSKHLDRAAALVTVSSTAAIEAAALGVPVLAIDDFGVSAELINVVFEGSGLLGSSRALVAGDFRRPSETWLDDNYFHDVLADDWTEGIEQLVRDRASGPFPLRTQYRGSFGGNLRRIWDRKRALGAYDRTLSGYLAMAVGIPARWLVLLVRWPVRLLRRRRATLARVSVPVG